MATLPQEQRPRTALALVREALLSLTHIVEDSTELVGATIREELETFRVEMARHALSLVAVIAGISLLTAGLAMFVSRLVGSWALTLVIFGALYLGVGVLLQVVPARGRAEEGAGLVARSGERTGGETAT